MRLGAVHADSLCKPATTSTAAPKWPWITRRGWGATCGEEAWQGVRCRVGTKHTVDPPKSMPQLQSGLGLGPCCPYASSRLGGATSKVTVLDCWRVPHPRPVPLLDFRWTGAMTSKKLPPPPPSLGFATWFSTVSSCGRSQQGGTAVNCSQQRRKNTFNTDVLHTTIQTHKSKAQPVPSIFEDQGMLRGCVYRKDVQWP